MVITVDLYKTTDNRLFWKTVKPLLPDKGFNSTKMFLVAEGKTVTEDKEVEKTFNQYFSTLLTLLKINLFLQKLKM